jgi:DNA-binding transcriptional ArsR family regulator
LTKSQPSHILNHVVNHSAELDLTFSAIADPTRRSILSQLARGETAITELRPPHAMSLPAMSKHIRVLEHAGLLTRRKAGRTNYCSLNADRLQTAEKWLGAYRRFWNTKLAALDRFLAENPD